jgi:hypothetical protein
MAPAAGRGPGRRLVSFATAPGRCWAVRARNHQREASYAQARSRRCAVRPVVGLATLPRAVPLAKARQQARGSARSACAAAWRYDNVQEGRPCAASSKPDADGLLGGPRRQACLPRLLAESSLQRAEDRLLVRLTPKVWRAVRCSGMVIEPQCSSSESRSSFGPAASRASASLVFADSNSALRASSTGRKSSGSTSSAAACACHFARAASALATVSSKWDRSGGVGDAGR